MLLIDRLFSDMGKYLLHKVHFVAIDGVQVHIYSEKVKTCCSANAEMSWCVKWNADTL